MGFWSSLGKIASVASFIPGPHQPFAMGAAALAGTQAGGGGQPQGGGGGLGGLTQLAMKYGGGIAGALSLAQGRKLSGEALNVQRDAMNFAKQRDQETSPFRALALRDITGPTPNAPDLGATYVDPTNPFASSAAPLNLSLPGLAPPPSAPAPSSLPPIVPLHTFEDDWRRNRLAERF